MKEKRRGWAVELLRRHRYEDVADFVEENYATGE